jgi:dihydrofolate reductase
MVQSVDYIRFEVNKDPTLKNKISIIAAIDTNRGLGKSGKLPWYLPGELKRFKALTMGHPIIMGRKTYESIGRPLPGRTNIIITRDQSFQAEGCVVVHSLDEAIIVAKGVPGADEVFIIGGGEIYQQALSITTKVYLTIIDAAYDVDTYFPDYSQFKSTSEVGKGEHEGVTYTYYEIER